MVFEGLKRMFGGAMVGSAAVVAVEATPLPVKAEPAPLPVVETLPKAPKTIAEGVTYDQTAGSLHVRCIEINGNKFEGIQSVGVAMQAFKTATGTDAQGRKWIGYKYSSRAQGGPMIESFLRVVETPEGLIMNSWQGFTKTEGSAEPNNLDGLGAIE